MNIDHFRVLVHDALDSKKINMQGLDALQQSVVTDLIGSIKSHQVGAKKDLVFQKCMLDAYTSGQGMPEFLKQGSFLRLAADKNGSEREQSRYRLADTLAQCRSHWVWLTKNKVTVADGTATSLKVAAKIAKEDRADTLAQKPTEPVLESGEKARALAAWNAVSQIIAQLRDELEKPVQSKKAIADMLSAIDRICIDKCV